MRLLLAPVLVIFGVGCVDKEAADPGEVVRAETVDRIAPPSRATSRTVRCGCSADGLHIAAPPGSKVTVPEDATHDAEAQIVLADDAPAQPIRRTRSLGFIGDNPLGASRTRGGPWNAPDGLLPQHSHGGGSSFYGGGGSYGYGRPGAFAPAPGYGAPGYGAPGYGAPAYGAPGYGAPGYGAPAYGAPGYGAPGHGAPAPYAPPTSLPRTYR